MFTVTKDLEKRELTLERIVRGSRGKAWDGWTLPQHVAQWWGPHYWTTTIYKMDVRVGGAWHYCMRPNNGEGDDVWGRAVYSEIDKLSRLVYTEWQSNARGDMLDTGQRTVTVEFVEMDPSTTKLYIRTQYMTIAEMDAAEKMGMITGLAEALDRFETNIFA
jgi:uncharacterized protein YndB with AHSA1/START domain